MSVSSPGGFACLDLDSYRFIAIGIAYHPARFDGRADAH
jgi:hypothetical protein